MYRSIILYPLGGEVPSDQLLSKRIGEGFTCIGEWWIPNEEAPRESGRSKSGTLTYSPGEGIKLDVIGQLEISSSKQNVFGFPTIDIILGISEQRELITLHKCHKARSDFGTVTAAQSESYNVDAIFVSEKGQFISSEEIAFKAIDLQYTHLNKWVAITGLQGPSLADHLKRKKIQISYEPPKKIPSATIKDYVVSIRIEGHCPTVVTSETTEATIEQRTSIYVKPRKACEISISDADTLILGIQNLLSIFVYDDPIYPLFVGCVVGVKDEKGNLVNDATVQMLYDPVGTEKPSEDLSQRQMLFTYRQVADIFESALNKLIVVEEDKLKPVFDQFFAEYYSPAAYVEDRFMATIRAIEAFHRRTCERDYYVTKQDYMERYFDRFYERVEATLRTADLPAGVRTSFRDSLKSRLAYGYQYSLRKRLDEFLDSHLGEAFLRLFVATVRQEDNFKRVFEIVDTDGAREETRKQYVQRLRSAFVETVVKTRNWFTHFDDADKLDAIRDAEELAHLDLKLRLFMIALLLVYVGVPMKEVAEKLEHRKFEYIRTSLKKK